MLQGTLTDNLPLLSRFTAYCLLAVVVMVFDAKVESVSSTRSHLIVPLVLIVPPVSPAPVPTLVTVPIPPPPPTAVRTPLFDTIVVPSTLTVPNVLSVA